MDTKQEIINAQRDVLEWVETAVQQRINNSNSQTEAYEGIIDFITSMRDEFEEFLDD